MANWYTADPHFGHSAIIDYCNRPFASANEMDVVIKANYSACVRPDDNLWIIGDFAHGDSAKKYSYLEKIFKSIQCRKHLVIGNHDNDTIQSLPWDSVNQLVEIKDGDYRLVLCHYPMLTWNGEYRGALQLFGHVHDKWAGTAKSINVGVDVWQFMPVQIHQIIQRSNELEDHKTLYEMEI